MQKIKKVPQIISSSSKVPDSSNIYKAQPCPNCGFPIGIVAGSKDAICKNCGYKDPCCE